ncbi:PREDICTED: uncharacterized protein LOC104743432 [Camelina sativa]|uniref:Uncharacterized protein LOC104743432 n=1 Tax=Camelina sativa TaxID=90675 RepID=A0ABM0VY03_CAMSA|nr:PREDICTED: uncharacterized protein LOC104743432 [Camelina sativa]
MADTIINSLPPTHDTKSPYYFHPYFIHQFTVFVSTLFEKLSEAKDNYVMWRIRFLDLLKYTNKIGFIDGTLEKPDPALPYYEPWKQCNSMVLCWLMNSVTETLQNHVLHAETAHKAWEDLRRVFVPCFDSKIYELRRSLATLRQGGDSVEEYFRKFSKAWMELSEYDPVPECNCEDAKGAEEAREKEQRYAFLMGLNKDLDYVRTRIMYKKIPPSLHDAYVMVKHSESIMNLGIAGRSS